MNRREASKKETRRLILKAARKLLIRKGGEECTIKDIAIEAGTSPASVVVHFGNKTLLLEEALFSDIEKKLASLESSLPADTSLRERLIHIPNGFFAFYGRNRNLYRALLRSTIFEPAHETPRLTAQSGEYVRFLTGIVEEEKSKGVIRQDVETQIVAVSIFTLYLGVLIMLFRMPELPLEVLTNMHSTMIDQYLTGITITRDKP